MTNPMPRMNGDPHEKKVLALVEQTKRITIWTKETVEEADALLITIKRFRAWWEGKCRPTIDKYHAKHAAALELFRLIDRQAEQAEGQLKAGIRGYLIRLKQEQSCEQRRLEQQAKSVAEQARKAAVAELKKSGETASAKALAAQPLVVAPVVAEVESPRLHSAIRGMWKFRITDAAMIPRDYLMPDLVKIGQVARAMKGETRIAGIDVYEDVGVVSGAGR